MKKNPWNSKKLIVTLVTMVVNALVVALFKDNPDVIVKILAALDALIGTYLVSQAVVDKEVARNGK